MTDDLGFFFCRFPRFVFIIIINVVVVVSRWVFNCAN